MYPQLDPGHTRTNATPGFKLSMATGISGSIHMPHPIPPTKLREAFYIEHIFDWEIGLTVPPHLLRCYLLERQFIDTDEASGTNDLTGRFRLRHDLVTGQPQLWFECACDEWPSPTFWLPLDEISHIHR